MISTRDFSPAANSGIRLPQSTVTVEGLLATLGIRVPEASASGGIEVNSPIDGTSIARLAATGESGISEAITKARTAQLAWRDVPAPRRGELIRRFADLVRANLETLAVLLTIENGKVIAEARGEVQEVLDICDHAVGLSRQLYGLTMASERPGHRLAEYWHPLGVLGMITAFNFPVAVWAWGATVAIACGNSVVWKPSEKTPLTALAIAGLLDQAASELDFVPDHLSSVIVGGPEAAVQIAEDPRVTVVSATGSTAMGRDISLRVAGRFGRQILELGGNNAAIVTPSADLDLALRAILFSATGTAGQRCTSLRRLIIHRDIKGPFLDRLKTAMSRLSVGNPLAAGTHVGPLISEQAFDAMQAALRSASENGTVVTGGERFRVPGADGGFYVTPALVDMDSQTDIVCRETFAPILYVMEYSDLESAIALQNGVTQGLSSSIFTGDMREAELFQSAAGSDCGIVNVNIATSGAEIGGAFGGEKNTGGGRVSGSDTWKNYMRRSTATINYSPELPLSQGVEFDVDWD